MEPQGKGHLLFTVNILPLFAFVIIRCINFSLQKSILKEKRRKEGGKDGRKETATVHVHSMNEY